MQKEKFEITLTGSPFEIAAQKTALQAYAKLGKDDRDTVAAYLKLASGDRGRLSRIITNGKALKAIAENWAFLEMNFAQ